MTSVKCSPYGNTDVATQVVIENNTAQVIAKGTKINWFTNAGIKGSQILQNNLAVGAKVTSLVPTPSNSTACTVSFQAAYPSSEAIPCERAVLTLTD
jgi:hypothetical protein